MGVLGGTGVRGEWELGEDVLMEVVMESMEAPVEEIGGRGSEAAGIAPTIAGGRKARVMASQAIQRMACGAGVGCRTDGRISASPWRGFTVMGQTRLPFQSF